MTSGRPAALRGLLAALVAVAATVLPAAPSTAAAACPEGEGVTVVVDFGPLGGLQVGCAVGDPATGLEALQRAGFSTERAALERSAYFICRINGQPADDPCGRAAPADAYWSYWHGRPGAGWTYSGSAVSAYDPAPGSVEGFAFGAGAPPGTAPPAPVAAPAPPSTTSATTPPPAPPKASSSTSSAPSVRQRTTSAAPAPAREAGSGAMEQGATSATPATSRPTTSTAPTTTIAPTTSPARTTTATPTSDPTSSSTATAPQAAARDDDQDEAAAAARTSAAPPTGTPAGPLVAAGLVALLAGAAGWQVLRRRPPAE